jgi:hypothetical protein
LEKFTQAALSPESYARTRGDGCVEGVIEVELIDKGLKHLVCNGGTRLLVAHRSEGINAIQNVLETMATVPW